MIKLLPGGPDKIPFPRRRKSWIQELDLDSKNCQLLS